MPVGTPDTNSFDLFDLRNSTRHRNEIMYTASFISLFASASAFVLPEGPWEHHWAVIVAG